jgi:hypothetical protein
MTTLPRGDAWSACRKNPLQHLLAFMTGAVRMWTISAENITNKLPEELACREKQAAILSIFYNDFYAASTFYVFIISNLSRINIINIKIVLFSLALDETYAVFKISFARIPHAIGMHTGPADMQKHLSTEAYQC